MSRGIEENTLDLFFSGPKQHDHLILSEIIFIIFIINNRPWLTEVTCSPLQDQEHSYMTPPLALKHASRMELI